jgi:hypothetical protein
MQWVQWATSLDIKQQCLKLETGIHLVPRSRKVELYFYFAISLNVIVIRHVSTGRLSSVTFSDALRKIIAE